VTASYISARFERSDLYSTVGKQRCILRYLDDGTVPPLPDVTYFPTAPDLLRDFLLIEYVNDVVGERLVRIANLTDINTYTVRRLRVFQDPTADFVAAGVTAGDELQISLAVPEEWISEEYPDALLRFEVESVDSATQLTMVLPFPSFKTTLNWSIAARSISGAATGVTRRETLPAPLTWVLDRRINLLFDSVPEMDSFTAASKTLIDSLARASTSSRIASENYTSRP
jgi:hypothetical protein